MVFNDTLPPPFSTKKWLLLSEEGRDENDNYLDSIECITVSEPTGFFATPKSQVVAVMDSPHKYTSLPTASVIPHFLWSHYWSKWYNKWKVSINLSVSVQTHHGDVARPSQSNLSKPSCNTSWMSLRLKFYIILNMIRAKMKWKGWKIWSTNLTKNSKQLN